jgi:hypothetical protein
VFNVTAMGRATDIQDTKSTGWMSSMSESVSEQKGSLSLEVPTSQMFVTCQFIITISLIH